MTSGQFQQQYKDLGYVISDHQIIPDDLLDLALQGVDDLLKNNYDTGISPHSFNWTPGQAHDGLYELNGAHIASSKIRQLIHCQPMIDFMVEVTGAATIQLAGMQLFYKSPRGKYLQIKNYIPYHQDGIYLDKQLSRSEVFSSWVPLCDMSEENGAMQYIARSHLLGPGLNNIGFSKFDLNDEMFKKAQCYAEFVSIPRGYLSIHHGDLFHGSGANQTDSPRIALVLHCLKDDYVVNKEVNLLKLDDPYYCPRLL